MLAPVFKKLSLSLGLLILTLTVLNSSHAETGYISDVLYVPMRAGKGNQFRIIDRALKSGTKLEILERDGEWIKAQTPNGNEGYIRAQYVIDDPTAKLLLQTASANLARANQELDSIKGQLQASNNDNSALKEQLAERESQLGSTSTELDEIKRISADALDLNVRHQELFNAHQLLQHELDVVKAENSRFKNDNRQKWFFYGAAAVLLGVIIALIVPVFKPQKRKSEWLN